MTSKKTTVKKPTAKKIKIPTKMFMVTRHPGSKDIQDYDGIFESDKEVTDHIDQLCLEEHEKVEVLEITSSKTLELIFSFVEVKAQ